jgi:hypothetical protein
LLHTGVSSYEAKRSKGGKQSPQPGPQGSTPPPDAAAAADAPSKQHKRASAGGQTRSKKQRLICILVPLMILAILGGIGAAIGITMGQQQGSGAARGKAARAAPAAAAPAPAVGLPLSFKVNMTLPPDAGGAPAPSCAELFSPQADRGKLEVSIACAAWVLARFSCIWIEYPT